MMIKSRTNYYDFQFQLVLVTKHHQPVFTTRVRQADIQQIIKQLLQRIQIQLVNIKIQPDNVQLILSFPPTMTPSNVVKNLKGSTARLWFKQHPETQKQFPGNHLWSPHYLITTIGQPSHQLVQQYLTEK